jgi:hypothetical protein
MYDVWVNPLTGAINLDNHFIALADAEQLIKDLQAAVDKRRYNDKHVNCTTNYIPGTRYSTRID